MKTPVTIATYKKLETACFVREKLQNKNIDCLFVHLGGVEDKTDYTRVQVDSEDVEDTFKVLMGIRVSYGMEIEEINQSESVRQIVVPTDFSEASVDACLYAIHLAQELKAEINLLHVFENPIMDVKMHSSETFETYLQVITDEGEKRATAEMIIFSERIRSYIEEKNIKDVILHFSVAMGNVIKTLKRVCRTCSPDLIVLGTRGESEGAKSIFAGVAKELVNDLKIPVFAIPGRYSLKDLEKMKILYATDFNESDNNSLTQLLRITEPFKKQITCIHIDTAHNPANEERIDDLVEALEKDFGKHDIRCRLVDYSDIYQGLKDFADSNKMNLLSFTVHKRGIFELLFMPNLFKRILQEANLPILIFPS